MMIKRNGLLHQALSTYFEFYNECYIQKHIVNFNLKYCFIARRKQLSFDTKSEDSDHYLRNYPLERRWA